MDIIPAIQASLDIVSKLRELGKKVSDADFKMYLADLTSALGDAKLEAANLKIELAEAKSRIGLLEDTLSARSAESPELDDGVYIFGDASRHYCTGCYDLKNQKILLRSVTGHEAVFGRWHCPACGNFYGGNF